MVCLLVNTLFGILLQAAPSLRRNPSPGPVPRFTCKEPIRCCPPHSSPSSNLDANQSSSTARASNATVAGSPSSNPILSCAHSRAPPPKYSVEDTYGVHTYRALSPPPVQHGEILSVQGQRYTRPLFQPPLVCARPSEVSITYTYTPYLAWTDVAQRQTRIQRSTFPPHSPRTVRPLPTTPHHALHHPGAARPSPNTRLLPHLLLDAGRVVSEEGIAMVHSWRARNMVD